jgi:hypothetical protein
VPSAHNYFTDHPGRALRWAHDAIAARASEGHDVSGWPARVYQVDPPGEHELDPEALENGYYLGDRRSVHPLLVIGEVGFLDDDEHGNHPLLIEAPAPEEPAARAGAERSSPVSGPRGALPGLLSFPAGLTFSRFRACPRRSPDRTTGEQDMPRSLTDAAAGACNTPVSAPTNEGISYRCAGAWHSRPEVVTGLLDVAAAVRKRGGNLGVSSPERREG